MKLEVDIDDFAYSDEGETRHLTKVEKETLESVKLKCMNVNEIHCYAHEKAIFRLNITLMDDLPRIHIQTCCPVFGERILNILDNYELFATISYLNPFGPTTQN